jgi:3-hydroxyisobutyrate dehydrogenase
MIGGPIAANLARVGLDVVVFDINPSAVDAACQAGARPAASMAALAKDCDVIHIVVVNEEQVNLVLTGTSEVEGVFKNAKRGSVVVIVSTIGPAACEKFSIAASKHNLDIIDAPVTGGVEAAREGNLTFLVGGDPTALNRAMYAIAPVARAVEHVGAVGTGQLAKLANNAVLMATIQIIREIIPMCSSGGIEPDRAISLLSTGSADSWAARPWGYIQDSGVNYPGGPKALSNLLYKDLSLAISAGHDFGVSMPVAALTAQLLTHSP